MTDTFKDESKKTVLERLVVQTPGDLKLFNAYNPSCFFSQSLLYVNRFNQTECHAEYIELWFVF